MNLSFFCLSSFYRTHLSCTNSKICNNETISIKGSTEKKKRFHLNGAFEIYSRIATHLSLNWIKCHNTGADPGFGQGEGPRSWDRKLPT